MGHKPDIIAEAGLQFFGRISASISHELKNVLAIVNENAGLLEDLTNMADRGQPIDPARLMKMAETLKKQIGRADVILKNMNRFSHSADETIAEVDLNQTLELTMALTARLADMRGIAVDLQQPANSLSIRTAPFYLMNFLSLCLNFSMAACGEKKQVVLVVEEAADSVQIRFRQLADLTEERSETFPSDLERNLLVMLEAKLTVEPGSKEVVVRLSKNIEKEAAP